MNYTFKNISTTKFSINDREFFKTFIPYYVDSQRIKVFNIYDSTTPLMQTTPVVDIDINGVTYANATLLMNALTDVLYVREVLGGDLDAAQIEANRVAIVALNNNKSDVGHNHDDRYYTEAEVDSIISNLPGGTPPITKGEVDGNNLNLRQANDVVSVTIDVTALNAQGAFVEYIDGVLSLKDASGNILSTTNVEAKESYYDKAKYLVGFEDDLNDLIMTDKFAIIKTTSGLYFFVSKSDNIEDFTNSRIHLNTNDEFYELGAVDVTGATFNAWGLTVTTESMIENSEYGFDFWKKLSSGGSTTLITEFTPSADAASETFTLSKSSSVIQVLNNGVSLLSSEWSQSGTSLIVTPVNGGLFLDGYIQVIQQ